MEKTGKAMVAIFLAIICMCFGAAVNEWNNRNEIDRLRESNELKREIIVTYGSYEQACDEIFLHNSEVGWDSLYAAQERLDSLFESEL